MARVLSVFLAVLMSVIAASPLGAQALAGSERETLVRLHVDRGGRAETVDELLRLADQASSKGLPVAPLINKIREGLAKGAAPQRIETVVRQLAAHLEAADRIVREMEPTSARPIPEAVTLLAESLGAGITPDEVRELQRQARGAGDARLTSVTLASAAKGLSLIKDARLSVPDGTAVMAESVRRGFRSNQILDVGREVKRRENDYRAGRTTLLALRDAIARGDRPDQLFRDGRNASDRAAAPRRDTTADRPERRDRPDTPERQAPTGRPEQPQRPERPDRPGIR